MMLPRDPNSLTLYEVLELEPGASEEEIRQAYKRLKAIYDRDSLVVYTLYTDEEIEDIRQRLDKAYDTIIDPRTRHEYDLTLFPDRQVHARVWRREGDEPMQGGAVGRADTVPEELPPDILPDTKFDGPVLARIREYKGLDLRDISARTKISLMNLKAIEEERFSDLPAPVYVRGFLTQIAKYLKLPTQQVVDDYMARLLQARESSKEKD